MNDLFKSDVPPPLAERMRPRSLDEFVGQEDLVGEGKILRRILENGKLESSLIFWGPPGCGKTTLARLIALAVDAHFEHFSAVTAGIADVKRVAAESVSRLKLNGARTILFIYEIHRFNKAQQDAFLPHIEDGTIVLLGATTENPYFEINSPIISRARVFQFEALSGDDVRLTLDLDLQLAAEKALGDNKGAIVAMNPQNGEVLAMSSNPKWVNTLPFPSQLGAWPSVHRPPRPAIPQRPECSAGTAMLV